MQDQELFRQVITCVSQTVSMMKLIYDRIAALETSVVTLQQSINTQNCTERQIQTENKLETPVQPKTSLMKIVRDQSSTTLLTFQEPDEIKQHQQIQTLEKPPDIQQTNLFQCVKWNLQSYIEVELQKLLETSSNQPKTDVALEIEPLKDRVEKNEQDIEIVLKHIDKHNKWMDSTKDSIKNFSKTFLQYQKAVIQHINKLSAKQNDFQKQITSFITTQIQKELNCCIPELKTQILDKINEKMQEQLDQKLLIKQSQIESFAEVLQQQLNQISFQLDLIKGEQQSFQQKLNKYEDLVREELLKHQNSIQNQTYEVKMNQKTDSKHEVALIKDHGSLTQPADCKMLKYHSNSFMQIFILKFLLQQYLEKHEFYKTHDNTITTTPIAEHKTIDQPFEVEEAIEPAYTGNQCKQMCSEDNDIPMNFATLQKLKKKPKDPPLDQIIDNDDEKHEKPIKNADALLMKQKLLKQLYTEYLSCDCEKKKYNILTFMQWCHRTQAMQLLRELGVKTIDRATQVAQRISMCLGVAVITDESMLTDALRMGLHVHHPEFCIDVNLAYLKDSQLIHGLLNVCNEKPVKILLKDPKQSFVAFRDVDSQELFIASTISQINVQKLDPLRFYDAIIVIKEPHGELKSEKEPNKPSVNIPHITSFRELQALEIVLETHRLKHLLVQADWAVESVEDKDIKTLEKTPETPGKLSVTLNCPGILKTLNLRGARLATSIGKLNCLRIIAAEEQNLKRSEEIKDLKNLRVVHLDCKVAQKSGNQVQRFSKMTQLRGLTLTGLDQNKQVTLDFPAYELQYLILQFNYTNKLTPQQLQSYCSRNNNSPCQKYIRGCMCIDDSSTSGLQPLDISADCFLIQELSRANQLFDCPCGCLDDRDEQMFGRVKIINSKAKLNRIESLIVTNGQLLITGRSKTLPSAWLVKSPGWHDNRTKQLDFITNMFNCSFQKDQEASSIIVSKTTEERGSIISQIRSAHVERQIRSLDFDHETTLNSIVGDISIEASEKHSSTYNITVKQLVGSEFTVQICSDQATTLELRLLTSTCFRVPFTSLRLIYRGKVLEDKQLLKQYNFMNGSRILCYVKAVA